MHSRIGGHALNSHSLVHIENVCPKTGAPLKSLDLASPLSGEGCSKEGQPTGTLFLPRVGIIMNVWNHTCFGHLCQTNGSNGVMAVSYHMDPYGTHAMLGSSCSRCSPQAAEPSKPAPTATPSEPSELPATPAAGSGTAAMRQQREAGTGYRSFIHCRAILYHFMPCWHRGK